MTPRHQPSVSSSETEFDITHGTVVRRSREPTGGYIARGATQGVLYTEPEVWLADASGRDHHFRGHQFDNAGEGQTLIVVTKRSDRSVLRARNLSAGTTFDSGDLTPIQPGPGGFIMATLGMAGLLAIPAFIAWLALAIAVRQTLFGVERNVGIDVGWHFKTFIIVMLGVCAWLMHRINTKRQIRAKTLRSQIDATFAKNGWQRV